MEHDQKDGENRRSEAVTEREIPVAKECRGMGCECAGAPQCPRDAVLTAIVAAYVGDEAGVTDDAVNKHELPELCPPGCNHRDPSCKLSCFEYDEPSNFGDLTYIAHGQGVKEQTPCRCKYARSECDLHREFIPVPKKG